MSELSAKEAAERAAKLAEEADRAWGKHVPAMWAEMSQAWSQYAHVKFLLEQRDADAQAKAHTPLAAGERSQ